MKNKTFWVMLLIIGVGTFLRLCFIDKLDGLWNDEYVSWYIASIPIGKNFIDAVFVQCHMPFYYLYLKFFIHYFGNSDLMLRLTSVLPGILSIISMYFVGKELKDKKLGYLCALITSLSSFLIYFSQEVRFYCILFLFSSLALLFTLKIIKRQNWSNLLFYVIFNLLIIFTHTIGFVFVLLNLIFTTIFIAKNEKYKKPVLTIWVSILLISLSGVPLIYKILTSPTLSQWWGSFKFNKLSFLLTDYFSPVLTNIVSAPDNFFQNFNIYFLIFAIIPTLIAVIGMIKALFTKKQEILGVFLISLGYVLVLMTASLFGKLVFLTKYTIEIYPTLILLMCFGLSEIKSKFKIVLVSVFCFLNILYIFISPIGAPKIRRGEGHKIVADLIKNANLNKNDVILLNYYPKERFEKYFNFGNYKVISINKGNIANYLDINSKEDLPNIDKKLLSKKLETEIINKLKPNQKIAVVFLNTVTIYSPSQVHYLFHNKKEYEKAPFYFVAFSYLKNKELAEFLNKLQISRYEEKGSWSVITFYKK